MNIQHVLGFVPMKTPNQTRMKSLSFIFFALLAGALWGQTSCDGYRYRYTGAFENISVEYDIPYGSNINSSGDDETLVFDLYMPEGDLETSRPLVIIAHGGFFISGGNDGLDVVGLSEDLAHMGYVVASISYRLGIDDIFDLETSFVEAVWRGVHDSRAAVRYFRKSVEEGNPYLIDPERIILGGVSAGGFIALHHAYVDDESEIPADIDETQPGLGGGLEGNSGNEGYSSEVLAIFNIAGAIKTVDYMSAGTNEPVVSIHGTADSTVPYEDGDIVYLGFPVTSVQGSSTIHAQADSLGLDHCLITVEGADHVPHVWDASYYDLTLSSLTSKLGKWVCDDYVAFCGEYDYTATSDVEETMTAELPQMFPNPASASSNVHVLFPSAEKWQLVNAMGQTLESGVAFAGQRVTWSHLAAGWYALRTSGGTQALIVAP